MKMLGLTEGKITKDQNGENVSQLEFTEVILVHCIIETLVISKIQESCIHLFLINHFVNW